jgi:gliding motility-associated lipoprotein GldD
MAKRSRSLFFLLPVFLLFACNSDYTVKPRGYYKIPLPPKAYRTFDAPGYPYTFEYPVYGTILKDSLFFDERAENPYWINIDFPQYGGRIHISYKEIGRNRFDSLVNDAYQMSYKQHTYRATGIESTPFTSPAGIEGVSFTLKGNAATPTQFFLTDSVRHFLRGALYFSATPNEDSLRPVIRFFNEDIQHMIGSFRWKE